MTSNTCEQILAPFFSQTHWHVQMNHLTSVGQVIVLLYKKCSRLCEQHELRTLLLIHPWTRRGRHSTVNISAVHFGSFFFTWKDPILNFPTCNHWNLKHISTDGVFCTVKMILKIPWQPLNYKILQVRHQSSSTPLLLPSCSCTIRQNAEWSIDHIPTFHKKQLFVENIYTATPNCCIDW